MRIEFDTGSITPAESRALQTMLATLSCPAVVISGAPMSATEVLERHKERGIPA